MKSYLFWVVVIVAVTFASCDYKVKITGNYATCYSNLYAELYFEKDSFRMVNGIEFLSSNIQYRVIGDSLYHRTFSEDRTPVSAKIEFLDKNQFIVSYPKDNVIHHFKKIDFNFDESISYNDFWKAFRVRKKERDCSE